jgi:hypothetical protein
MIKDANYRKREGGARLAAIRVDNIDDSLEVIHSSNTDLLFYYLHLY